MTVSDSATPVISSRLEQFRHDLAGDETAACTALRTDLEAAAGPLIEPLPDGNVLVTFVFEAEGAERVGLSCELWPGGGMSGTSLSRLGDTDFWYASVVADPRVSVAYEYRVDQPELPAVPEEILAFLSDTLWPEIARRHHLRDDVRGLGGHSLGSLLVVHALFQRRPFFNRALASAPSLWWDDRAALGPVKKLAQSGTALPAKVFLSSGEDDTPSMLGDLALLEQQLATHPFPQLEVISRRFPNRDHFNVIPDAFRTGLRALFA